MFPFETLEKDADKLIAMPAKTAAETMMKTWYDQEELGALLDHMPTEACKDILECMDERHKNAAISALVWSAMHRYRPHSKEILVSMGFWTKQGKLALYKLARSAFMWGFI